MGLGNLCNKYNNCIFYVWLNYNYEIITHRQVTLKQDRDALRLPV